RRRAGRPADPIPYATAGGASSNLRRGPGLENHVLVVLVASPPRSRAKRGNQKRGGATSFARLTRRRRRPSLSVDPAFSQHQPTDKEGEVPPMWRATSAAACFGLLVLPLFGRAAPAAEPDWKVGLARVKITPERPVFMAGYASRNKPF